MPPSRRVPDWPTAAAFVPASADLAALASAAQGCRGCPLHEDATRPEVVVLLGATAGKAVFGSSFRVTQSRGVPMPWPPSGEKDRYGDGVAVATIHPSAVLRSDDRAAAHAGLVADLTVAAGLLR